MKLGVWSDEYDRAEQALVAVTIVGVIWWSGNDTVQVEEELAVADELGERSVWSDHGELCSERDAEHGAY